MTENQVVSYRLSNWNQEHLLKYWNELTTREQTHLQNEILGIDFDHFDKLFKQAENNKSLETRIDYEKNSTKELQIDRFYQMKPHDLNRYELEGLKAISQGHVAVIVLAGGLSSRLSISYPKGMFSIDSLSSKTLFQLQAERLVRLKQIAHEKYPSISGIRLPWYIMTSEHTHSATVDFFQENNYFGLDCNEVVVFKQAMWPCMTTGNKMILDTKCSIKKAPNGNGGLYKALVDNQILQSMSKNYGTKHVHVYGVENILVKIADPVFTGYCVKNKAECAAKVVNKVLWNEPISRVCFRENKLSLIDQSLVRKQAVQVKLHSDERSSIFSLGDMGYYFFGIELLEDLCKNENSLEVFKFKRRLNFLDANGKEQKQSCTVYEKFLADLFPNDLRLYEVDRSSEYSPLVYMSTGELYNRYSCKASQISLHYNWLIKAGAKFHYCNSTREITSLNKCHDESNADDLPDLCEVSPLVSYCGENLERYVKGISFEPPLVLDLDTGTNQVTYNNLLFKSYAKTYLEQ